MYTLRILLFRLFSSTRFAAYFVGLVAIVVLGCVKALTDTSLAAVVGLLFSGFFGAKITEYAKRPPDNHDGTR